MKDRPKITFYCKVIAAYIACGKLHMMKWFGRLSAARSNIDISPNSDVPSSDERQQFLIVRLGKFKYLNLITFSSNTLIYWYQVNEFLGT